MQGTDSGWSQQWPLMPCTAVLEHAPWPLGSVYLALKKELYSNAVYAPQSIRLRAWGRGKIVIHYLPISGSCEEGGGEGGEGRRGRGRRGKEGEREEREGGGEGGEGGEGKDKEGRG